MEIIDEANEEYEDSSSLPDKDEEMPSLQQENTSPKPIRKILAVPKQKTKLPVYINPRKQHDAQVFKNDSLRKKYDLRNKDPKEINDIFLRAHIQRLKERSRHQ